MESIWDVTNRNFAQFLVNKPLAVLYFWADWYSGDGFMKYRMKYLARQYPRASFGFMDLDRLNNLDMVKVLGVKMNPSVGFFCQGAKHTVLEGPCTILTMTKVIKETLKTAKNRHRLRLKYSLSKRN
jgi:thioredoxin-like negative regulator of GroEL